jgi:hypothetical protein
MAPAEMFYNAAAGFNFVCLGCGRVLPLGLLCSRCCAADPSARDLVDSLPAPPPVELVPPGGEPRHEPGDPMRAVRDVCRGRLEP